MAKGLSYRDAGVDIDAGDALVEAIKPFAKRTMRPEVLAGIGGFGALCELPKKYRHPVLVAKQAIAVDQLCGGFDFISLDLRLSRRFKLTERLRLETLAEAFNLLNRSNFLVPNNIFGAGTVARAGFGSPTAAFDPRQVQFGLRLSF